MSTKRLFWAAFVMFFAVAVQAQEICDNGLDDDNDGLIDCADPDCTAPAAQDVFVITATDDAEEEFGMVETIDLNLDLDFRPGKYVATRFQNLNIPAGAFIEEAHITFTASSGQAGASDVMIHTELNLNPATFADVANGISGRTQSTNFAIWNPTVWNNNTSYQTPSLIDMVQEVVDLAAGGTIVQNMVFIFDPASSGKASAASFESANAANHPVLRIAYSVCDSDGDGISDNKDYDDDNDGIPDNEEGACTSASETLDMASLDGSTNPVADINAANFSLQGVPMTMSAVTTNGSANLDDYEINDSHLNGFHGPKIGVLNSSGSNDYVRINFDFTTAVENFSIRINDIDDEDAIQVNGYLGGQLINLSNANITTYSGCVSFNGNNEIASACLGSNVSNSVSGSADIAFPSALDQLEVLLYQQPGDGGGSITISAFNSSCSVRDLDGDLIPDYIDLDSDNDGIADIIEAGGIDSNNDGRSDYPIAGDPTSMIDADADGYNDSLDPTEGGSALPIYNTDNTGRPDFLDIDADDDGIVDIIEGQSTPGYREPTGLDSDRDGWDNEFDSDNGGVAIVLNNIDTDLLSDYRDLDTDGDGENDHIEGYDTTNDGIANTVHNGLDIDGDGLDDAFDNETSGLDPKGNVTNNFQTPATFPISAINPADRAWRVAGGSSFPVEWLSFDAILIGDDAVLDWTTATELNAAYFEVERSLDGNFFEHIGEKAANGTTTGISQYSFKDAFVTDLQSPTLYYRLRQVDFDGSYSYSNTIELNLNAKGKLVLKSYPNPASQVLNLEFATAEAGQTELTIVNTMGQKMLQMELEYQVGIQTVQINVQNWAQGMYLVQMNNEKYESATRFFKN